MCGEGMGCVGLAGTVPAAGSEGACTCWEVASGDGGGSLGRRARGRALGKATVGVGGGEGGGLVVGGGVRLLCGGGWGGGGERRVEPPPAVFNIG
jgi:hypothetical protein